MAVEFMFGIFLFPKPNQMMSHYIICDKMAVWQAQLIVE
jgi:hypothetical protein